MTICSNDPDEEVCKSPGAVLSYGWDWSYFGANDGASGDPGWLQGDTISGSAWAVTGPDSDLVIDSQSNSTVEATVVLSGGTLGRDYLVTNHITTSAGLEDDRTLLVKVRRR